MKTFINILLSAGRRRGSALLPGAKEVARLRAEVADLALLAASKVVGETMTDARQRRLVDEFLSGSAVDGSKN